MKNKKGLWIIAGILIVVIIVIFVLRDSRNMEDVIKDQLQSAKDSASSKLDQLDIDFNDEDLEGIEEAVLAYDTIQ